MGNTRKNYLREIILSLLFIVIGVVSFFIITKFVTTPSFYPATIESLDDKKITVVGMVALVEGSSTIISMIPGDATTPVANQIADLTSYFLIILGALFLAKILLTSIGYVSFGIVIPVACILGIIYLFTKRDVLKVLAIKLAIFGIILFVAIPTSIKVSDLVYEANQAPIEQSVEVAERNKDFIEGKKEELATEDKNWIEAAGDYLSDLNSKIGKGISVMVEKGEAILTSFMDAVAVLIITTCVIPILVIIFFGWIIKLIFNFEYKGKTKNIQNKVDDSEMEIKRSKYVS